MKWQSHVIAKCCPRPEVTEIVCDLLSPGFRFATAVQVFEARRSSGSDFCRCQSRPPKPRTPSSIGRPIRNALQSNCCGKQAASGEEAGQGSGAGRSRGRLTTKIHMPVDALGRPPSSASQVGDVMQEEVLLVGRSGAAVLADKAYDSNALRETIAAMRPRRSSPQTARATSPFLMMPKRIATATVIERCFNRLKCFRRFPPAMIAAQSTSTACLTRGRNDLARMNVTSPCLVCSSGFGC